MTDKTEEAIRRGARAKAMLDEPLMTEAFAHIEAECFRLFQGLSPTDIDGMQQVKAMHYYLGKFKTFLEKAVKDGVLAKAQLEPKQYRPKSY
ncbi:MAG TPA: hypothetical protein PK365_12195 [Nitrospira sp.]|nr:hypothetical protein [Nitrospira sp.]HNG01981.1 hypothetical protein [Nitrospira sp.]HNI18227.1 hypothetical protein [Nitrospira sp.]